MAIKVLGHVWKTTASGPPRKRVSEWAVERREPSPWNPISPASASKPSTATMPRPAEPVWAETQPWWHD